jgi:hypothetical protein
MALGGDSSTGRGTGGEDIKRKHAWYYGCSYAELLSFTVLRHGRHCLQCLVQQVSWGLVMYQLGVYHMCAHQRHAVAMAPWGPITVSRDARRWAGYCSTDKKCSILWRADKCKYTVANLP